MPAQALLDTGVVVEVFLETIGGDLPLLLCLRLEVSCVVFIQGLELVAKVPLEQQVLPLLLFIGSFHFGDS